MPVRIGISALTVFLKSALRVVVVYQERIDAAIDAAVAAGTITAAQAAELKAFLAGLAAAVLIVRAISGY